MVDEKIKQIEKDARNKMAILCEEPTLEDSLSGMLKARDYVRKHGDVHENSQADVILAQWMWAHCEEWYHSENGNQQ